MIESKKELKLVNDTTNDHGINELNIEFNSNYIENIIREILDLRNSVDYVKLSYGIILNVITKKYFYSDQVNAFLSTIPKLFDILSSLKDKLNVLFPNQKQNQLAIGVFEGFSLKEGSALYYNKHFYQGEFNKEDYEFKGVYIPNINNLSINIGLIRKGLFEGIEMNKMENGSIKKKIYSSTFQIELNEENNEISFYSICEPKQVYYFKEQTYFIMEDIRDYSNNCYFYLTTHVILSFEIAKEEAIESKPVTLLYDNNHMYIGEIKNFKRNGEGKYIVRNISNDHSFELIGMFENDQIKQGKVLNNSTLIFDGVFENNKPRNGIYYYSDKENYVGEIKDGHLEGEGKYSYENGDKFCGVFKDNLPFIGTFTDSYGSIKDIQITNEMLIFNNNKNEEDNIRDSFID